MVKSHVIGGYILEKEASIKGVRVRMCSHSVGEGCITGENVIAGEFSTWVNHE